MFSFEHYREILWNFHVNRVQERKEVERASKLFYKSSKQFYNDAAFFLLKDFAFWQNVVYFNLLLPSNFAFRKHFASCKQKQTKIGLVKITSST